MGGGQPVLNAFSSSRQTGRKTAACAARSPNPAGLLGQAVPPSLPLPTWSISTACLRPFHASFVTLPPL